MRYLAALVLAGMLVGCSGTDSGSSKPTCGKEAAFTYEHTPGEIDEIRVSDPGNSESLSEEHLEEREFYIPALRRNQILKLLDKNDVSGRLDIRKAKIHFTVWRQLESLKGRIGNIPISVEFDGATGKWTTIGDDHADGLIAPSGKRAVNFRLEDIEGWYASEGGRITSEGIVYRLSSYCGQERIRY